MPKHNFNRCGVSHIAMLTAIVALTQPTVVFAQSITINAGDTRSTPVVSTGDGDVITNAGTIAVVGVGADAISATGADAEITNAEGGVITTSGLVSRAIVATGDGAEITNAGDITTDAGATGISVAGGDVTVSNTGTITGGAFSSGIASVGGANVEITNSGTIMAIDGGNGIASGGVLVTITNTLAGTISTTGSDAHGIISTGDDATISNVGAITTTGAGSIGILATGDGAEITISGSVSATGENAYAVRGSDAGDQTLTLLPGARLTGGVNLGEKADGTDNDVVNIMAYTGPSLSFEGVEELVNNPAVAVVRDGDTVAVIDPTGSSATRMALGATTGQIHRQVSQRLAFTPAPQVMNGAETGEDAGGWATFFGSRAERDDDGMALAWKHNFRGVVMGYDTPTDSGQRVGLFAGFGREEIRTSEVTSITDTASREFVGIYGQHVTGNLTLDGSLVFGRGSHKSTRNIAGDETANGKYNSTFISPSLTLTWSQPLPNGFELRPGAQVSYIHGSYDGYMETGSTNSNVTFGKRKVNIVDSRLQLALAQPFAADRGEIEWRAGVTATHYGNNSASAQLGSGAATSYAVPGDRSLFGGFVGVTLDYAIEDRVSLTSSVEYARTSGDASGGLSGQLGLAIKF